MAGDAGETTTNLNALCGLLEKQPSERCLSTWIRGAIKMSGLEATHSAHKTMKSAGSQDMKLQSLHDGLFMPLSAKPLSGETCRSSRPTSLPFREVVAVLISRGSMSGGVRGEAEVLQTVFARAVAQSGASAAGARRHGTRIAKHVHLGGECNAVWQCISQGMEKDATWAACSRLRKTAANPQVP